MAPGGLVEVRISWPGHPRYLKKKKFIHCEITKARVRVHENYFRK